MLGYGQDARATGSANGFGMPAAPATGVKPGVCLPWENMERELPDITGNPDLVKSVWEDIDGLGNMFIWQCLLSF